MTRTDRDIPQYRDEIASPPSYDDVQIAEYGNEDRLTPMNGLDGIGTGSDIVYIWRRTIA